MRWPRPSAAAPAGPCPRHGRGSPPDFTPPGSPPVVSAGPREPARPARGRHGSARPRVPRRAGSRGSGQRGSARYCPAGQLPPPVGVLPRGSGRLLGARPGGFPGPWDRGLPGRCARVRNWAHGVSSKRGRKEQPLKAGGVKEAGLEQHVCGPRAVRRAARCSIVRVWFQSHQVFAVIRKVLVAG